MIPQWGVVEQLISELGSIRAAVVEAEAELPEGDEVVVQLRRNLSQATHAIHLVFDGDGSKVADAWQTIAEAQQVAIRAHLAVEDARDLKDQSAGIRAASQRRIQETKQHIDGLRDMQERREQDRRRCAERRNPR